MLVWLNSHGLEVFLAYFLFSVIAGSVPPLPETAGFWAKWGYAILHGLAGNLRAASGALAALGVKVPWAKN